MKLPNNIIAKFPIRQSDNGAGTYVDVDRNGELAMDDTFTAEPVLNAAYWELEDLAGPFKNKLITPADLTEQGVSEAEQEYEGSEDWQSVTTGDLSSLATELAPSKPATWAINPKVDGKPDEMEFLILKTEI